MATVTTSHQLLKDFFVELMTDECEHPASVLTLKRYESISRIDRSIDGWIPADCYRVKQ